MPATHAPPEDLVTFLSGQTVNSRVLTAGTNLFSAPPETGTNFPARAVFIWSGAGGLVAPYLGSNRSIYFPSLQVRVRGDPGSRQEARVTARDLMRLLHRAAVPNYSSWLVRESDPLDLGRAGDGMQSFGFNLDGIFSET